MNPIKKKVVLITEIIAPYRIPIFNEIAKNPDIDFQVLFLSETEPERSWRVDKEKIKFPYQVLGGIRIPLPNRFPIFFNAGISKWLKQENPDVIICGGYHHPSNWLALGYAKKHKKRLMLWCETHAESMGLNGFPFHLLRRHFIRSSDGFLVPGRKSRDFIRSFGVASEKIWIAPNAVDNDFFWTNVQRWKNGEKRKRFSANTILYVGRMTRSKGIDVLLEAVRDISKSLEVNLVFVGDGKEKQRYENLCGRYGLKNVFFEGYKQQEELPYYYGVADLFILPSIREEWGLVLNEAVASGLPVISTETAGAAFDLIEEGRNGFRVSPGDAKILKQRILDILSSSELQVSMGQCSRKKADEFSPAKCATGFVEAIQEKEFSA